ncbi:MAG: hypothetical protein CEO22_55 [Candidatus Berkelbacteria bacterium Gr01-1014_85]|uniref:Peptidase C39-like domain-containing protein n=1 Tax=Candidatus Berkelbacteria bacterium Gr01-1014_85 TaxID=2017150 RepID=A0A554JDR8_9BACT|nr:MAG: hypothetical protein CEO22_55 [Candidatus Berkelbacteria bacterium Gr01-1014_85]
MALDSLSKAESGSRRRQTTNQIDALRRVVEVAEVVPLSETAQEQTRLAQEAFEEMTIEADELDEAGATGATGVAGRATTAKNSSGNPAVDHIEERVKQRLQANLQARAKAIIAKATAKRAAQAAGQVAVRSAATAAVTGASSVALGPILIGIGVVIMVVLVVGLLFAAMGAAGQAQGEGSLTGTDNQIVTVAEARTNGAKGLKLINTPTDYLEATAALLQQAEELYKNTAEGKLKQQLLPILEKMRQQAKELEELNKKGDRAVVVKKYQELLATSREFNKLLVGDECGSATVCLDVPLVGQGSRGQCGMASMIMVLRYYESVYPGYQFNAPSIYNADDQEVQKGVSSCLSPDFMNKRGPQEIKDFVWTCHNASDKCRSAISRGSITQAMIRSLEAGDPLVLYLNPNGAVTNSKHIVAVVGYDANDEPGEGGVFIINNPNVGLAKSVKQTRFSRYQKSGQKLTAKHLERHYGGGSGSSYQVTAIIRQTHLGAVR